MLGQWKIIFVVLLCNITLYKKWCIVSSRIKVLFRSNANKNLLSTLTVIFISQILKVEAANQWRLPCFEPAFTLGSITLSFFTCELALKLGFSRLKQYILYFLLFRLTICSSLLENCLSELAILFTLKGFPPNDEMHYPHFCRNTTFQELAVPFSPQFLCRSQRGATGSRNTVSTKKINPERRLPFRLVNFFLPICGDNHWKKEGLHITFQLFAGNATL